ncbi:uncharacterized protein LOC18047104 isoform X3 [Citrus clementina]|uniref:uncharacterized protein LOC18047104 isoform X3 n=1 Tax=Citrus clementina TaxID=85681 RepID=UPI000CECE8ED|nr:uncharacterized protein LOC18047104 isoform X3 [Citrus x clementina]
MSALTKLTKTLAHHCVKKSKTHWCKPSQPLLNLLISENIVNINTSQFHQYQSRRTLILDSASSESVQLQRISDSDIGIIEVSLNRPAAKNALGTDMLRGLKHAFETISEDSSANVVMIRSSVPKVFCAGADLKALPIPTIAVIDGAALGGGLEMALACDLRICGEAALLGLPETGLAIIPGVRSPLGWLKGLLLRDWRWIWHRHWNWKKSATLGPCIQRIGWRAWLHLPRSGNPSTPAHREKENAANSPLSIWTGFLGRDNNGHMSSSHCICWTGFKCNINNNGLISNSSAEVGQASNVISTMSIIFNVQPSWVA